MREICSPDSVDALVSTPTRGLRPGLWETLLLPCLVVGLVNTKDEVARRISLANYLEPIIPFKISARVNDSAYIDEDELNVSRMPSVKLFGARRRSGRVLNVEHGTTTVVSAPYLRKVRKVAFHSSLGNGASMWVQANACSQASLARCSVNSREHFYKLIRLAQPRFNRPIVVAEGKRAEESVRPA
ncbi:hypothetical protein BU25DRAFT_408062 [Macroventuria anomochaeta]|uniref:Uncharacterized protein n=1 Tax=Macroventuria anomochaeta TaxID=301207 RepID=A0ACB6S948_9PLEO|nr:uncharacterized protein BU25DRAFT_408062 [Macroventuria anomochaeta]KAF2630785.1 hypothetical protein BU25DRAFT_408062 [Macroventuria anomochaeta]